MGKSDELEKASQSIKEAEDRQAQVHNELQKLNREISQLLSLETILVANIKCLKKKNIVAVAVQFRKAARDLQTARTRLALLKSDRETVKKALKNCEKAVTKAKETYNKLLRSFENNVVRGNFGGRNNGSR